MPIIDGPEGTYWTANNGEDIAWKLISLSKNTCTAKFLSAKHKKNFIRYVRQQLRAGQHWYDIRHELGCTTVWNYLLDEAGVVVVEVPMLLSKSDPRAKR